MPKEITHWLVATEVLTKLEDNSRLKELLSRNLDYYLLGAVIYDTPYSYPGFTRGQKAFRKIADLLHGNEGEEAFAPFKSLIRQQQGPIKGHLLAFSLGVFSHLLVDCNFHPAIYYYTGNYYSKNKVQQQAAVSNHRWLETQLDLWFLAVDKSIILPNIFLKDILKDLPELSGIIKSFSISIPINNPLEAEKRFPLALFLHGYFQRLFFNRRFSSVLSLLLGDQHKVVALFYPSQNSFRGETELNYLNPVTGEPKSTTFTKLKDTAIEQLVNQFSELEGVILRDNCNQSLKQFLDGLANKSLETGMAKSGTGDMKYFSDGFDRRKWLS